MRQRGFEISAGWEDKGINLPVRKTKNAVGYDIEAAEDTVIPSMWKTVFSNMGKFLKGDKEYAQLFYSLGTNYAFLTNILRKSIYEYYVGRRYILKNQRSTSNMFEKKMNSSDDDFELLQLDMIISTIEAKWVDNA